MQILKARTPSTAGLAAAKLELETKAKTLSLKISEQEAQAADVLADDDSTAKKWRKAIAELREELGLVEQRLELLAAKIPEAVEREAHEALVDERRKALKAAKKIDALTEQYNKGAEALAPVLAEMRENARLIYRFNTKMRQMSFKDGSIPLDLQIIEEPDAIREPREIWNRVQLPSVHGYGRGVDGIYGAWPPGPKPEAAAAE